MNISWGGNEETQERYTLKISEEEKKLLDEAIWYQISILATLKDLGGFKNDEEKEFELYKSIYKKLGNKLEDWVEEV
ncbi:TPA: hypothetical protein ACNABL_004752 [Escherichia coli]